jgi:flagellar basal body-associated protein FliL
MTTTETDDRKPDKNWPVITLCIAFMVVVLLAAVLVLAALSSLETAERQVNRRTVTVEYLGADNYWDNCNDQKDREFNVAIARLLKAATNNDDSELALASKEVSRIGDELKRIDEPEVCGPPPAPPAVPHD